MDKRFKAHFMKLEKSNLKSKFSNIYFDEKLSKYSWFNLGGLAEIFYRPDNKKELSNFLKYIKKENYSINIFGAGSNTLIRDGGVKGISIKLSSKFSYLKNLQNNEIEVGAATLDKKLSDYATQHALKGFEFLSCIPGSIGGAIRMNSGCYGNEISENIISIEVMNLDGEIKEIKKNEINFFYRGCDLKNDLIILSVKFKTQAGKIEDIKNKQIKLIELKKNDQPQGIKTCGSTFKNPKHKKAWKLIKESNCEKFKVGKAKISEKHCNFFVNEGSSSSSEIEELINKVREEVKNKTGESLELEIRIVGEKL